MFQGLSLFAHRSAWHGAVTFIMLWLGGLSVFSFLGLAAVHLFMGIPVLTEPHLIDQLMTAENLPEARVLQIISSIGAFLIPGWIFTKVVKGSFFRGQLSVKLMLAAILIPIAALPLVDWLATLNALLTFPIESIDEWMRMKETEAGELYDVFLAMNGPADLMLNLVMMAALPAIGEELLFRAGLQQYLGRYLKNHHLAIWVAAIVFSAIHFQFYSFIPRLVMGAGLGYLFHWGGHIGYAIVAHFVNNATAVITTYLSGTLISEDSFENLGSEISLWLIGSFILVTGMYALFGKSSGKPQIE